MIGLVLVTHGRLALELVAALEHVVGPQETIATVCIGPDDDMEQRRQEIVTKTADVNIGSGVIVEIQLVVKFGEVVAVIVVLLLLLVVGVVRLGACPPGGWRRR